MKPNIGQGDTGKTHLLGGKSEEDKVSKDHPQVESYGTLDELNSLTGYLRTYVLPAGIDEMLADVQDHIFRAEAHISASGTRYENHASLPHLGEDCVKFLEKKIGEWEKELPEQTSFSLPGGTREAAVADMCRTLARRAERRIVSWRKNIKADETGGHPSATFDVAQAYVNRLSDFFFALERLLNKRAGKEQTRWKGSEKKTCG